MISLNTVFQKSTKKELPIALSAKEASGIKTFHQSIDNYAPTPLHSLPVLAEKMGLGGLYIKDESFRFGLNAFKSLGATWALARILCQHLDKDIDTVDFSFFKQKTVLDKIGTMTFATATDGNHGRGLAWAAKQFGCRAKVFMPAGTVPIRVKNIEVLGADVMVTKTNYDNTVRMAAQAAEDNDWVIVQDTSWKGYETIPLWVLQGYTTMAGEVLDQIKKNSLAMPTHLFLQAGVGSMPAAILGYYANVLKEKCPATYILEPNRADCMYQSALRGDGNPVAVTGALDTMMAGLACGEPNPFAWEILRDFSSGFISCSDEIAAIGMRCLAHPLGNDPAIVSGESAAVGPGLADVLSMDSKWADTRKKMGLDKDAILLCFSTEGDTDPENYQRITGKKVL